MDEAWKKANAPLIEQAKAAASKQAALEVVCVYLLAHVARLEGKGVVGLRHMTAELLGFADGISDVSDPIFTQTVERLCTAAEDILRVKA